MKVAGWLLCLLAAVAAVSGCNKNDRKTQFGSLRVDSNFSLNVVRAPHGWPDEEKDWNEDELISAQQQRVYEDMGKPDFFLLKWHPDGRPVTSHEFETASWVHKDNQKENPFNDVPDISWVYLDDGVVYSFTRRAAKRESIKDTTRLLCEYGDPYEIKDNPGPGGATETIYQYYDIGKIFYFRDGHLFKEQDTPRLEGFIRRR